MPPLPAVVPIVVEPLVLMPPALPAVEPLVSLPPVDEPPMPLAEEPDEPIEVVSVPVPVLALVVLPAPPAVESFWLLPQALSSEVPKASVSKES